MRRTYIESYSGKERIATTVVTQYEMLRGATKQNIDFISELLNRFIILILRKMLWAKQSKCTST